MNETLQRSVGQELLKHFGAIRIINLASRADRRREITREFAKIGLEITADGPVRFYEAAQFSDPGPFPLTGARGCWHSHVEILREALNGKDNILIFEDDCDFVAGIEGKLANALESLAQKPWSIFYGGHELVDKPDSASPFIHIDHCDQWLLGAHFVGFNRAILERLVATLDQYLLDLEAGKDAPKGIDSGYSRFRRLNPELQTYLAWPKLGFQRPSHSDISGASKIGRLMPRHLVSVIRTLKRYARRVGTA
ncbi:glycosyltransferase family 25 protein [Sphingobium sp. JS3065]|uniref:glycosyltransferase family 25 protein n=1 Tax=Sphingobium sp. JS3065 TaxID=2970925 RepID=UPI0022641C8A|nr:glycosyltransferase family 25 protein [Sphingobium sp. JS3065]UZW56610.1 glycosyltransferase family 25 protein [Sphingobium sp. JS3065]